MIDPVKEVALNMALETHKHAKVLGLNGSIAGSGSSTVVDKFTDADVLKTAKKYAKFLDGAA